jgi:hypothetical protein
MKSKQVNKVDFNVNYNSSIELAALMRNSDDGDNEV